MKKLALSILILSGFTPAVKAGDTSYDQLLKHITPDIAAQTPAPSPQKAALPVIEPQGRYWVTANAADKQARTRLLEAGLDIVEVHGDKVSGLAHANTLKLLSTEKSMVIESAVTVADYLAALAAQKDFPTADAAYHNYAETTRLLKDMAAKNPEIASIFSIGKTFEGREIWCLRINSSAKGEARSTKPGALYIGNHHAREHLSNEVPLLFAAWLFDHKGDADIKKYIAALDIYIIPMLNGDGAEFDIRNGKYEMHRKNTRVNPDNTIGVDLNRNYDSWWCQQGASHSPWADTYCGAKAFSEPESQAVKKFTEARPNLKTHISYHSYASTILYPWGGSDDEIPNVKDRQTFINIATEMGKLTGYHPEKSSDMYVATGDSCDWAYAAAGIFAFTFELEGNGFYPGAAIITGAVQRNIKAAVYLLSVTDNPHKAS